MSQRNHALSNQVVSAPFQPTLSLRCTEPRSAQCNTGTTAGHRIAVVDDHDACRSATVSLLEHEGYRVHSFASGEEFLIASLATQWSCVLLDVRMPNMSGLDVLRVLSDRGNRPPVLVLSGFGDIPMTVEAMRLGAFDFLEKPYVPDTLLAAVDRASACRVQSQANLDCNQDAAALVSGLSTRQRQVLAGIVKGQPNKLIAYDLGLSIRTVESYRAHVLAKLGVHSTAEAVRIAIAAGTLGIVFSWSQPGSGSNGMIQARPTDRDSTVPGEAPILQPNQRWEATLAD